MTERQSNPQDIPPDPELEREETPHMRSCYGVNFGWFMEDMPGDEEQREQCFACHDFDKCWKMSLVKALVQLRFEVRNAGTTIGRGIGGSHSTRPFS
jgi:hypothetical protein